MIERIEQDIINVACCVSRNTSGIVSRWAEFVAEEMICNRSQRERESRRQSIPLGE